MPISHFLSFALSLSLGIDRSLDLPTSLNGTMNRRKYSRKNLRFTDKNVRTYASSAGIEERLPQEIIMEYEGMLSPFEGPNSEELSRDILPMVLQKAGMATLLSSAPCVAKAWHRALRDDPKCWENLDFPEPFRLTMEGPPVIPRTESIMSIVDRSCRRATSITLCSYFKREVLEHVGNNCPALQSLSLHPLMSHQQAVVISNQISNWRNLRTVTLMGGRHMNQILPQISRHCRNFDELVAPQSYIGQDEASLIVTTLPGIKHLFLKGSTIGRENLVTIIQGCERLSRLDVSDCTGFEGDDAEIRQLASGIPVFKSEGSRF